MTGKITQIKAFGSGNDVVQIVVTDSSENTETFLLWGIDADLVPFADWINRCAMLALARDALARNLTITVTADATSGLVLALTLFGS